MKAWTRKRKENREFYRGAFKLLAGSDRQETAYDILLQFSPSSEIPIFPETFDGARIYRFCELYFPVSLSMMLLAIYSSEPKYDEDIREIALVRLHVILLDHVQRESSFAPLYAVQELGRNLVFCLDEQVTSKKRLKTLSYVVSHVAYLISNSHSSVWYELRDYIISRAETDFGKVVHIFQRLPFPLENQEFLCPVIRILFPAFLKQLGLAHGSRDWGVVFTGAFALAIQMIGTSRVDLVGDVAYRMLTSLSELVNRGIGQRLLREALLEMKDLVRDDGESYNAAEYRFVSGLILRINGLRGMATETKKVVWEIQETLERQVLIPMRERSCAFDDWLK